MLNFIYKNLYFRIEKKTSLFLSTFIYVDNGSEWENVTCSVPQGYVRGPILFTIFINNMLIGIKNECMLYADDS